MLISVKVNGEVREVLSTWTIADLLADLKIENRYCAVERNLSVVPREQHSASPLQAGDQIECSQRRNTRPQRRLPPLQQERLPNQPRRPPQESPDRRRALRLLAATRSPALPDPIAAR